MSFIRKAARRVRNLFPRQDYKKSYSQCGEDIIVSGLFQTFDISSPTYLDLGAHHPTYLSNTYLFYRKRSYGVCVEPDPGSFQNLRQKRKRDICLNVGVGTTSQDKAEFFLMSESTLNTFSGDDARRIDAETSYKIIRTIQIPLVSVNEIIAQNFQSAPNFVSLDIEGLDLEILESFDFGRWRPEIFCIETAVFSDKRSDAIKIPEIARFMEQQGYFAYADTYINTIFVDKSVWVGQK